MVQLIEFDTARFDPSAEPRNPINPIAGHSVLTWLRETLGPQYELTEPAAEDWGWYSYVDTRGARYLIGAGTSRDATGEPPHHWMIQITKRRGFMDVLFGRNHLENDDPLSRAVQEAIRAQPDFDSVEVSNRGGLATNDKGIVVTGKVLPGPTMTPPYASDVRCVVWAAGGKGESEASASGALSFVLLCDDGMEVAVEPTGAAAVLAIRSGIEFQRELGADGRSKIRPLGVGSQAGSTVTGRSRIAGWVAIGDAVTVEGRLVPPAPFRGRHSLAATRVRIAGGTLEVASLEPGEAEPLNVSTPPPRSRFSSEAERLAAWIRQRLADKPSVSVILPGVEDAAVYLHGSIGYDSAITSRGVVWVNEYELDGPNAFKENWRPAGTKDGTGYLVIATRNHPELGALLPQRTPSAQACTSCKGTGERHVPTTDGDTVVPIPGMICAECSGLGWLAG